MQTSWQQVARGIELVAIVLGMLAISYEFGIKRLKDRDLREVQLHATVATLAADKEIEVTGFAVDKILSLMHREKVDMTGISFPNVIFYMAEFEVVDWSDAFMKGVEFTCTDRHFYSIRHHDGEKGTPTLTPCAKLKGSIFSGSFMREMRFHYADLSGSDFTDAALDRVRINDSSFSYSNFSDSELSGIRIALSDFSGSELGGSVRFDCWATNTKFECASLNHVDFSQVKMPGVEFRGARISSVDFSRSNMERAKFECDEGFHGEKSCTEIKLVCLEGTNLVGANLQEVSVSNTDFSGADIAGASFNNVTFEKVVISDDQIDPRYFDDNSLASLYEERVAALSLEERQRPCTAQWRRELTEWEEKFGLKVEYPPYFREILSHLGANHAIDRHLVAGNEMVSAVGGGPEANPRASMTDAGDGRPAVQAGPAAAGSALDGVAQFPTPAPKD